MSWCRHKTALFHVFKRLLMFRLLHAGPKFIMATHFWKLQLPVTDIIALTELVDTDSAQLVKLLNQTKQIYDQTLRIPYPYTMQDASDYLRHVKFQTGERILSFAIREMTSGMQIGGAGIMNFSETASDTGMTHKIEIGYWLGQDYWGQGLMVGDASVLCILGPRCFYYLRHLSSSFIIQKLSILTCFNVGFGCKGPAQIHLHHHVSCVPCGSHSLRIQQGYCWPNYIEHSH